MNLKQAIRYALNGDAILFCGSGFSIAAKNQKGEKLKTAGGLCERLINKGNLNFENDGDIEFLAQKFIECESEDKLIELLHQEYIVSSYENLYNEISRINWKRIYTTNYDDILEKSSDKVGIPRIPVTLDDKPSKKFKQKKIIHLNGYIKRLDNDKLCNEFKLTEKSYLTRDFIDSEWSEIFRNDIRNAKAIIFIGYSMKYDLDIKRIIFNNNENINKIHFINGDKLSNKEKDILSEYGNNHNIGLRNFVKKVKEVNKYFEPIEMIKGDYDNFKYYNNEEDKYERIEDEDMLDLFIFGRINMNHARNSPFERKYLLKRDKVSMLIKDMKENPKVIVITADMANGKTCFMKSLVQELINEDYNVFEMDLVKDNFIDEFEHISKNYENKCMIIDNYHLFLKEMEKFQHYAENDITYIISSRTLLNDIYFHSLGRIFSCSNNEILPFDINRLTNNEINQLINIFNEYNLWGEYSSKSIREKKKILKKKFKCKFQNILIGILESTYIKDQIKELLENIDDNSSVKKMMLGSFINYVIGINLKVDELIVLLNGCKINATLKNNIHFRELIDFKENEFKIKSALLANYIINQKGLKKEAIEVLIEMAIQADKYKSNKKYENFLKIIVSFSNIQFLLRSSNNNKYSSNIINYYDRIKNLDFNRKNPYFWFQYAIARLDIKQYKQAKNYFKTAYSYAEEQSNYNTIQQLNTHYARYLLENQIENGTSKNAFKVFNEAHEYINSDRKNKSHYHYPLRQSKYYYEYYIKFYDDFSEYEKSKFMIMCTEILEKINSYKNALGEKRSPHSEVVESEKNLRKLLAKIRTQDAKKENIGYVKKRGLKKYFGYIKTNKKDVHFWKSECDFYVRPYDLVEFEFVNNDKGGTAKNINKIEYKMF